jgi:hypothetical protein
MPLSNSLFLPSITTTSRRWGWQAKVAEISELGLEQVALFPTGIGPAARQALYRELERSPIKEIPFVHLRSDMTPEEVGYLVERFGMRLANIHPHADYPLEHDLTAFNDRIAVENRYIQEIADSDLAGRAGVCLDISHHEDCRLRFPEMYQHLCDRLRDYPCACWHVSAVGQVPINYKEYEVFSDHKFTDLQEFDYAVRYREHLPPIVAMELENPLAEQLKAIERLKQVLGLS